jgi:hypothetical protein
MRRLIPFAMLALLAGCATVTPEQEVRHRLIAAGLKPPVAACLAEKLVRKLSPEELRRLGHAAELAEGRRIDDMTVSELVERVAAIGDPHIVEVVTRAGIGCAIAG